MAILFGSAYAAAPVAVCPTDRRLRRTALCLRSERVATCIDPKQSRPLLALGAKPADVGQTGVAESWHVLTDPQGNEFRLLHARIQAL